MGAGRTDCRGDGGGWRGKWGGGRVTKFILEWGASSGEASLFGEGGHFRRGATELPVWALMCNVTSDPKKRDGGGAARNVPVGFEWPTQIYICILRWILHSTYFHFRATLNVFIHFKMFKNYCLLLWVTDSSQQPCQWHSVPYWPGVEPHNTGCLPGKTTHFTATHHVRTTTKKQK